MDIHDKLAMYIMCTILIIKQGCYYYIVIDSLKTHFTNPLINAIRTGVINLSILLLCIIIIDLTNSSDL